MSAPNREMPANDTQNTGLQKKKKKWQAWWGREAVGSDVGSREVLQHKNNATKRQLGTPTATPQAERHKATLATRHTQWKAW